ncbi:hypothetical protein KC901_01630 [Patescibacteria group bacterium]|nr:hypothetical protein [Patescibacteria group bacterium]
MEKFNLDKFRKKAIATVAGITAVTGMHAGNLETKGAGDHEKNPAQTTAPAETNTVEDSAVYDATKDFETRTGDPVESKIEVYTIDVSRSFNFERAKLTPEEFENGKNMLVEQMKQLPFKELTVTIEVSRSPEKVIPGGYDAGRGWVNNLEDLAEDTAEEIEEMVQAAAQELGITVTTTYAPFEGGVDKNNPTRHATVTFKETVEKQNTEHEKYESGTQEILEMISNNPELAPIYKADVVVLDTSGSMTKDMQEALDFLTLINEKTGKKIKVINLEGKSNEAHARTLKKILEGNALVISDEPDSTIQELFAGDARRDAAETSYREYIDDFLSRSKATYAMRILNPNEAEGGFKEFTLNEHPYVMMPLDKRGDNLSGGERTKKWYDSLPNDLQSFEKNSDIASTTN